LLCLERSPAPPLRVLCGCGQIDAILLDPAQCSPEHHSAVYVFLLAAKAAVTKAPDETFIAMACRFFSVCDAEQVSLEPKSVSAVCKALVAHLETAKSQQHALLAVRPLKAMLGKMSTAGKPPHMTVVHRPFAQVCILAKCYKEATAMLDAQIIDLPANRAGLEPYDIVVYAYYGAMIHIGMKRYMDALTYLRMAFTASVGGPTSCLVEAYKKYILASLIAHGSVLDLPKWSGRMQQQLLPHVTAYTELKDAFVKSVDAKGSTAEDASQFAAKIKEHEAVFTKDGNLGLVKQTVPAAKRRSIKRLTQTYLTLSLADIAAKTGVQPDKAEATILDMIDKGEVYASINQRDGMVSFLDSPERYDSAESVNALHAKIEESFGMSNAVRELSEHISTQKEFIKKQSAMPRNFGDFGGMEDAMDLM
jgi:COP9 signalosome complex subunit 3